LPNQFRESHSSGFSFVIHIENVFKRDGGGGESYRNVAGVKKGTASVTLVPVHILKDRLHDLNYYDKIILRAWLMVSEKVR
jgi:hypothetical protein